VSAKVRPVLGSILFFAVAPAVVAGWIPYSISRWRMQPPFLGLAAGRWAGGALAIAGFVVLLDSFARFALVGEGTPAPIAPTNRLVVSGLYRYVRNPMYLAVVGAIAGQALLFANAPLLAYALGVWLLFHLFVLGYEEPTLRRQFGDSYLTYQREVRRWWPRLTAGVRRIGGQRASA
jgi:protein-S-isoprenylcysteine O-methyltransferase Ste14